MVIKGGQRLQTANPSLVDALFPAMPWGWPGKLKRTNKQQCSSVCSSRRHAALHGPKLNKAVVSQLKTICSTSPLRSRRSLELELRHISTFHAANICSCWGFGGPETGMRKRAAASTSQAQILSLISYHFRDVAQKEHGTGPQKSLRSFVALRSFLEQRGSVQAKLASAPKLEGCYHFYCYDCNYYSCFLMFVRIVTLLLLLYVLSLRVPVTRCIVGTGNPYDCPVHA